LAKGDESLSCPKHMSRFEIEDIVSQDKRGIFFRAHDSEKGHTIALRRFFPFGQDGGGLKEEESVAFRIAAQRLEGVTHPALRSVFSGAVDPIDNMPYMVAEWVDGAPLDSVLNGEVLDARLVIQILQHALEVSQLLSEILGEEGVWVETETDSIFVGSEESGRRFIFWLSPFKWLGAEFGSRKLTAIVDLGEQLAGWKGKLIGDQAGFGLGGWLKWMKNHPDASLAQALESLPVFTADGETPPPPKPSFTEPVAFQAAVNVKQPSSASPIIIASCVALLLAVGGLAYYRFTVQAPTLPPLYAEQKISPPAADTASAPDPEPAPQSPTKAPGATEAISASRAQEMAEKLAKQKEAERAAALAPPVVSAPPIRDFAPADADKMRALKANSHASVTGTLRKIRFSGSGQSMYFEFSSPFIEQEIRAVLHKNGFQGDFSEKAFADLVGKKLRFDGVVFREPSGRQYVKISARAKIADVK